MDVPVPELHDHTVPVLAGRPTDRLLVDLRDIADLAERLGVRSPAEDFDVELTTDDMAP